MSARHRISELLLRQGIQYSEGKVWIVVHHARLRQQRFELVGLQSDFDAAYDELAVGRWPSAVATGSMPRSR